MLFSSMVFLWVFLPIVLIIYTLIDGRFKNAFLLFSSLVFYSWGEPKFVALMIASAAINYIYGLYIQEEKDVNKMKALLLRCIFLNLAILVYFKYFNFIISNINNVFNIEISTRDVILPIGISFYTFQSLSYVVDVYRSKKEGGTLKAQKNFFNLALYISLFPQLIAGPIIKYHDVEKQIQSRKVTAEDFSYGIKRFVLGLSKKVLISNVMAKVADSVFIMQVNDISTLVAWIGIICYSLQIYFDFSGYSDMAVGLGRMFGFRFLENFNYPYISLSIQDFWRRWHISLSTWFKEYLYIPLGGNRFGDLKTYRNLIIVFLATGIWHGASWNFIVWGAFHGVFIVLEKIFLGDMLKNSKVKAINHIYVIIVFIVGWVFFRSDNLIYSIEYIKSMFIWKTNNLYPISVYLDAYTIIIIFVGITLSGPIQKKFPSFKNMMYCDENISFIEFMGLCFLLFLCVVSLASGTYNPFIYFRF